MAKSAKPKKKPAKKSSKPRKKPNQLAQVTKLFTEMVKSLRILNRKVDDLTDGLALHREKMTERHKEIREALTLRPLAALLASAAKPSPPDAPDSLVTDAPSSDQTLPSA